jgi:D-alanine-D-alanine ligase
MAGIPTLGSDAVTHSVALDKAWARALVSAAGVPVAEQTVMASAAQAREAALPAPFPLFVKPRWEGTSKGIAPSSKVASREALAREVERIARDYAQPALVERFLGGPEFTVTVIGNAPPRALPALQRALEVSTGIGVHALERHPAPQGVWRHHLPGGLDAKLEQELAGFALRAYAALECRDFARADFRLDAQGVPRFLEINGLPTFAPDGSFGILAELEGRPVEALVADVIAGGLRRLGLA